MKFTLSAPFGPFLSALAGASQIVNQKAVEAADPARNPVGTGPFKFVEWVPDDHVTLERWDQYFKDGKPYLDQIVFRGLPVDDTRMAALQSGEVNWVDAIPLQKVASVSSGDEYNYYTAPVAGLPDFLVMNCSKPPFDNIKLRQAVAWATDRETILQLAYSGVGEVANEEMATGSAWHSGLTTYSAAPDIEKAKQLLTESGFDTSQSITYLGLPQYPELLRTGEILKDNLSKIGLNMEIEQQEVTVWGQNLFGKNYEITSAYAATMLDPDDFYHGVLYSTRGLQLRRLCQHRPRRTGGCRPDRDRLRGAQGDLQAGAGIVNTEVPHHLRPLRAAQLRHRDERARYPDLPIDGAPLRGRLDQAVGIPFRRRERRTNGAPARNLGAHVGILFFIVKRILIAVPVLIGMSILVFSLIHLVPGDPALVMLGLTATPENAPPFTNNSISTIPSGSST